MRERDVVLIGLPSSGKTTFLAALWYLLSSKEESTRLRLRELGRGDRKHLNGIADQWSQARVQSRTQFGTHDPVVRMQLAGDDGGALSLTFPDLPGEAFTEMWERREVSPDVAAMLKADAVILMVHADEIRPPQWVREAVAQTRDAGLPAGGAGAVAWKPEHTIVQVQLVELLQLLRSPPLDVGPRRLVLMLSAWDKAGGVGLTPDAYLRDKLPLLWQYLEADLDRWNWRVLGVSAQGGDYEGPGGQARAEAERLRQQDVPSRRIQCVSGSEAATHDLTEPLQWLIR